MSSDKYLVLKGCAGLGNRLYTLSRAIEYAALNNRKIYVDWSDGQFDKKGENPFYDYFELDPSIEGFDFEEIINETSFYPALYRTNMKASIYDLYIQVNRMNANSFKDKMLHKLSSVFNLQYGEKLFGYWCPKTYGENISEKEKLKGVFDKNSMPLGALMKYPRKEKVVVYADFSPAPSKTILLEKVKLKSNLLERIKSRAKELEIIENCIGVHVRYTDKKPTRTLEALIQRCEEEVKSGKKIFLATDNVDIEETFKNKLGEKLILNEKMMPEENANEGLHRWAYQDDSKADLLRKMFEESIIDMWLLAECEILFYQGNSSFSIFSSIISRKKSENWLNFSEE